MSSWCSKSTQPCLNDRFLDGKTKSREIASELFFIFNVMWENVLRGEIKKLTITWLQNMLTLGLKHFFILLGENYHLHLVKFAHSFLWKCSILFRFWGYVQESSQEKKRFLSSHPTQIYEAYRRLSSHVMHSQDLPEIPTPFRCCTRLRSPFEQVELIFSSDCKGTSSSCYSHCARAELQ